MAEVPAETPGAGKIVSITGSSAAEREVEEDEEVEGQSEREKEKEMRNTHQD